MCVYCWVGKRKKRNNPFCKPRHERIVPCFASSNSDRITYWSCVWTFNTFYTFFGMPSCQPPFACSYRSIVVSYLHIQEWYLVMKMSYGNADMTLVASMFVWQRHPSNTWEMGTADVHVNDLNGQLTRLPLPTFLDIPILWSGKTGGLDHLLTQAIQVYLFIVVVSCNEC